MNEIGWPLRSAMFAISTFADAPMIVMLPPMSAPMASAHQIAFDGCPCAFRPSFSPSRIGSIVAV